MITTATRPSAKTVVEVIATGVPAYEILALAEARAWSVFASLRKKSSVKKPLSVPFCPERSVQSEMRSRVA